MNTLTRAWESGQRTPPSTGHSPTLCAKATRGYLLVQRQPADTTASAETTLGIQLARARVTLCIATFDSLYPGWRARAYACAHAIDVRYDDRCPLALASGSTFTEAVQAHNLTADLTVQLGLCPGDSVTAEHLNHMWAATLIAARERWEVLA